jgi:hypothetical protein
MNRFGEFFPERIVKYCPPASKIRKKCPFTGENDVLIIRNGSLPKIGFGLRK